MKKSTSTFSVAFGLCLALTLCLSSAAHAQTSPPPQPPPAATSSGTAFGGAPGAGLGVGAAAFLSGLGGLDVVYDVSRFHIEGLLGFSSLDAGANRTRTSFEFGARGWYHLHTGTNSDFSLGGGLGVRTASGGGGASVTATLIEPGMQARAFITPNFTFNLTAGLTMVFGDSVDSNTIAGFGLGAQLLGGVGITYFFR